jgi:hypothetical protein
MLRGKRTPREDALRGLLAKWEVAGLSNSSDGTTNAVLREEMVRVQRKNNVSRGRRGRGSATRWNKQGPGDELTIIRSQV